MTFTPVNESSSTANKKTALCSTITVEKAGSSSTLVDQLLATVTRYKNVVSPTIVALDTANSAKSPPTMFPPAKLSSVKSSPTKPFPTIDLILVTRKTTLDHAPATLPFQVLESLCDGFFPDRHFDSIQEAGEITMKELTQQDQWKFMHGIYDLFTDIYEVSNTQVAWLSNSGQVREMVKQLNTVQKNKDHTTKKLGDNWQQSPELFEILNEGDGIILWAGDAGCILSVQGRSKLHLYTLAVSSAPKPSYLIGIACSNFFRYTDQGGENMTPDDVTEVVDDVTQVVYDVTQVVNDVTQVVNDVTQVVNEDDKDTSSDNESSETAVNSTPIRT
ncbi:hypothetical protein K440DRAFT_638118 [Wilcoxina mikolae CBS 423.85]|nr:hypothetical protein K440DRAFT_638118 [Wilcoxina mikolae CBS 423.85]